LSHTVHLNGDIFLGAAYLGHVAASEREDPTRVWRGRVSKRFVLENWDFFFVFFLWGSLELEIHVTRDPPFFFLKKKKKKSGEIDINAH
jgi:hypothetical protein